MCVRRDVKALTSLDDELIAQTPLGGFFPGYHRVVPFEGTDWRVSLAFNIIPNE